MSIEAGIILLQTREDKGVSINEASEALHIRSPYLQALENGRAEIIPSAVQARGFLRIYAEYLGIDPIEIIQEWDQPGSSSLSSSKEPADDAAPAGKNANPPDTALPYRHRYPNRSFPRRSLQPFRKTFIHFRD